MPLFLQIILIIMTLSSAIYGLSKDSDLDDYIIKSTEIGTEHKEQINKLNNSLNALKSEINESAEKIAGLQDINNEQKKKIEHLNKNNEEKSNIILKNDNDIASMIQKFQLLKNELNSEKREKSLILSEKEQLISSNDELNKINNESKLLIHAVMKQKQDSLNANKELSDKLNSLITLSNNQKGIIKLQQQQKLEIEQDFDKQIEINNELKNDINNYETLLSQSEANNRLKNSEITILKSTILQQNEENKNKLSEVKGEANSKITSLELKIEELTNKNKELQEINLEAIQKIDVLTAEFNGKVNEIKELKDTNTELNRNLNLQVENNKTLDNIINKLNKQVSEDIQNFNLLKEQLSEKEKDLNILKEEFAILTFALSKSEDKIALIRAERDESHRLSEEHKAFLAAKSEEIRTLNKMLQHSSENLEKEIKIKKKLEKEINELNTKIKKFQEEENTLGNLEKKDNDEK